MGLSPHSYNLPLFEGCSYTIDLEDVKRENKVFVRLLDGFKQFDFYYKYMSYYSVSRISINQPLII